MKFILEPHISNYQPDKTFRHKVVYRCHGSDIIHLPHFADFINWTTTGAGTPTIGAISEYVVVGGLSDYKTLKH